MGTQEEEEEAMDCSTTNKDANGAFDYEFAAVAVAVTKGKRTKRWRIHPPPFDYEFAAVAVAVTKGKRTKRWRIHPPPPQVPTAAVEPDSSSSSDSSAAAAAADEEDEDELDMANCLILLAQGHRAERSEPDPGPTPCDTYKCRTCDKRFPSFQALGGHRASHKKPKPSPPPAANEDVQRTSVDSSSSKLATAAAANNNNNNNNNNSRVHECAICGSEFNSGQALGGHMRKHRPLGVVPAAAGPAVPPAEEAKNKERILLSLDLNLPAPADDDSAGGSKELQRAPPFGLSNNPPPMIFSASLVGCHY
ncbi:zinc finger protein ZAT5-like [Ananas comosus]|uniref:Zinc finger protein ZAT5-like n=1 Tax=Ananas comosus TaxID=4615 RepID=A0A6P5FPR3_ANACO|nr:zinc finger protein ZAT5-like [Ananas comosus]